MTPFFDLIVADDTSNISVHKALACLGETRRGAMTSDEAYKVMGLTEDDEKAGFDYLVSHVTGVDAAVFVWNCFYLAKAKVSGYDSGSDLESKITLVLGS